MFDAFLIPLAPKNKVHITITTSYFANFIKNTYGLKFFK